MKRYIVIVLILLAAAGLFYFGRGKGLDFFPYRDRDASSTPIEAGTREIYLYFSNSKLDPEVTCTKVFPVVRRIQDTPIAPRLALENLLSGPTAEEKAEGYSSSIPLNVKAQNLVISGTVATADFGGELGRTAGSCNVAAIRSEISETLRQFSPISTVIITVNGKSEGILEP
jgi:spore germination protein GerM